VFFILFLFFFILYSLFLLFGGNDSVYYTLYRGGYAPASFANRESGYLNNSAPSSPAADGDGLEQRERLESSISQMSGSHDFIIVIIIHDS